MSKFVLAGEGSTQVKYDLSVLTTKDRRLGGGGEGDIYAISDNQCVKILTNPDVDKIAVLTHAVKKFRGIWHLLDEIATTPWYLVYDETGRQVIGYGMRRLNGWQRLVDIMTRDSSKQAKVGMKETARIFLVLQLAVALVHKQGFIIGDFNSSNVFFQLSEGKYKVMLIDADSWSVNRPDLGLVYFPGITDEMELYHPDFLRADIGDKDGKSLPHPQANQGHDWWAFSYLFWKALTKHDPFTGGEIKGETKNSRLANMMAGVDSHLDFETDPEIALSTLRLGPIMQNTLNRFLTLKFRRAFPSLLVEQFIGEVCACPKCGDEMSRLAVFCSRCMTALS